MEKNIDNLISENIMNWIKVNNESKFQDSNGNIVEDFSPSSNIIDAFTALDIVCRKYNCRAIIDKNIEFSEVTFKTQLGAYINFYGIGNTLELAICQAILASVNIHIDTV